LNLDLVVCTGICDFEYIGEHRIPYDEALQKAKEISTREKIDKRLMK